MKKTIITFLIVSSFYKGLLHSNQYEAKYLRTLYTQECLRQLSEADKKHEQIMQAIAEKYNTEVTKLQKKQILQIVLDDDQKFIDNTTELINKLPEERQRKELVESSRYVRKRDQIKYQFSLLGVAFY